MFHFTRCSKIKVTCPAVALLKVSMTACASHNCHCAIAVHTGQTPTNKYYIKICVDIKTDKKLSINFRLLIGQFVHLVGGEG